jgi:hypothetical protein
MGGRKVRCKACGGTITIPVETAEPPRPVEPVPAIPVEPVPAIPVAVAPLSVEPDAFSSVPPLPATPPPLPATPPPLPPRRPAAVISTPPPPFAMANPLPPPPGFSIGFQFRWWKPLPILLGLLLLAGGTTLWADASHTTGTPRTISCKTLATSGPGSNHHILLTDFKPMHYYARLNKGTALEYEMVPLVSPQDVTATPRGRTRQISVDPNNVRPGSIQVLLKTTHIHADTDFAAVLNRPSIECTTGGMFDTIPAEARRIFQNRYPGIDFSKCVVISEGTQSGPGIGVAIAVLSAGLIVLMAGIGLLFLKY